MVGPGRLGPAPLGLAFLATASLGWGLNFPVMKQLLTELPPLVSRGLSGLLGALALALIAWRSGQSLAVPRRLWLRLFAMSQLALGGWVAFMGLALVWLKAGEAALLATTVPLWVMVLAWPLLGERITVLRIVALAVAIGGIAILFGVGPDFNAAKWPGVAFALAGAVGVAAGTILTKKLPIQLPPITLAAWQIGIGCAPVTIAGFLLEQPDFARVSATGWACVVYLTLGHFCLSYVCWFAALQRLPAATAAIGTLLVPVVSVVAAGPMLGEPLGLREIAALGATLAGVALALRS